MLVIKIDQGKGDDPPQLRGMRYRYKRARALRSAAIQQFTVEQKRSLRWIQLADVARQCQLKSDPTKAPNERDECYRRALCSLLDAALAGEFLGADGQSRLFRAHREYRLRHRWLNDPDNAPLAAFVTQQNLWNSLAGSSDPEISRKVAFDVIANCWVPRVMAVDWLTSLQPPVAVPRV